VSVRLTPPGWHSDLASAVPKLKTARQTSGAPLSTPLGTGGAGPGVSDENLWFQLSWMSYCSIKMLPVWDWVIDGLVPSMVFLGM
jgi:hypothetical protein